MLIETRHDNHENVKIRRNKSISTIYLSSPFNIAVFRYCPASKHQFQTYLNDVNSVIRLFDLNHYYFRFIPESIPWLVANNRRADAEDILLQAARYNNRSLPPHHILWQKPAPESITRSHKVPESSRQKFKGCLRLCDVIKSSLLRRYTAILLFIW